MNPIYQVTDDCSVDLSKVLLLRSNKITQHLTILLVGHEIDIAFSDASQMLNVYDRLFVAWSRFNEAK